MIQWISLVLTWNCISSFSTQLQKKITPNCYETIYKWDWPIRLIPEKYNDNLRDIISMHFMQKTYIVLKQTLINTGWMVRGTCKATAFSVIHKLTRHFLRIAFLVISTKAGSSTANAGKPIIDNRALSTSCINYYNQNKMRKRG